MKIKDLAEALTKMTENGHGDLPVKQALGNGTEKNIMGWELVNEGMFDSDRTRELKGTQPRLRLFTTSPF